MNELNRNPQPETAERSNRGKHMTRRLLRKELKLTASPLTYLFVLFSAAALIPNLPSLLGTVCVCLGIFYSFLNLKEDNDILFLFLLPNPRKDVVKAKYAFVLVFEAVSFLLSALFTLLRMTVLSTSQTYSNSLMMPVNLLFLGLVLLIFGCFNSMFLGGFFQTMQGVGKPFSRFLVVALILTGIGEGLYHIPGLGWLRSLNGMGMIVHMIVFFCGAVFAYMLTRSSYRKSVQSFETYQFTSI